MNVAIIGPICRDEVIIKNTSYSQPGGATYYTGVALRSLGVDTQILATYSSKDDDLLTEFDGMSVTQVEVENTIHFINEYPTDDPDLRIQKVVHHRNPITLKDAEQFELERFDWIIIAPLLYDNVSPILIQSLRASHPDVSIVLAPQGMIRYPHKSGEIRWRNPENVLSAINGVDYVFLDESELEFITSMSRVDEGIKELLSHGVKNVAVTRGNLGSILHTDGKSHLITAYDIESILDPTGAGDSYLAGFIRSQELTDDPVKQGEFAAMTASCAISRKGPLSHSTEEILDLLGNG